jgi:alcohol dehydrogenase class IV
MEPKLFPMRLPSMILFGCGAAQKVGEEAKVLGAERVLIVCDPGIASTGMVDEVKGILEKSGLAVGVYSEVVPEPPVESLEACVEEAREGNFDLVIGLGGGSSMDAAKVVAVMTVHSGRIEDMFGTENVPGRGVPTIMMPTTAGTGSEATVNSILTDTKNHVKKGVVSRHLMPDVAIVDPLMTLSCPPKVSAASGMDTLTHAVESYVSVKATPETRLYALESIKQCARYLRTAVLNGANVTGREGMARASLYAGISISNAGTAAVHAMAYPLGAKFHTPHGVSNALLLPYVMEFNYLGDLDLFVDIAEAMGEPLVGLSRRQKAEAAVKAVRQLSIDVGIPQTLSEVNVTESSLGSMADAAIEIKRLLDNNPRSMTRDDIYGIYKRAF